MVLSRLTHRHRRHHRRRVQQQQQTQGEHPALDEALAAENALTQDLLDEKENQPFNLEEQQEGFIPMNGNSTSTVEGNQDEKTAEGAVEEENHDFTDVNNTIDYDTLLEETPVAVKNETEIAEESISAEQGTLSEQDPIVDKNGTSIDALNIEEGTTAEKMKLGNDNTSSGDPAETTNSTIKDPTVDTSTPTPPTAINDSPNHSSLPEQHPLAPSSSQQQQHQQGGGYGDFFSHYVAVSIAIVALLFWAQRLRRRCFRSAQPEEPRREGYQFV